LHARISSFGQPSSDAHSSPGSTVADISIDPPQISTFLSSTHQAVTDGGVDLEEQVRAAEFEQKVQRTRINQPGEDVGKVGNNELAVAGWLVPLTTGVPGFKVRHLTHHSLSMFIDRPP
jgi:hypothetical protein